MVSAECIVPAAGESSRMGDWKLMLPVDGVPIIDRVLNTALVHCPRVILVTGYRGDELEAHVAGRERVSVVMNEHWQTGMFSSIQKGIAEVRTDRFFVCLADLPLLAPEIYKSLAMQPEEDVVVPVHDGRRGHPVLLGRRVAREALETDPEKGIMRDIVRRYRQHLVEWPDDSILRDADTPEEYRQIAKN